MDLHQTIAHWRGIAARHRPLLTDAPGTPRHLLVAQAERIVRILDPEVKVWTWHVERHDTGLLVASHKRWRLGRVVAVADG
jgi:hypothetical protein